VSLGPAAAGAQANDTHETILHLRHSNVLRLVLRTQPRSVKIRHDWKGSALIWIIFAVCFRRQGAVELLHNHVDAASLGLAICDCKERQVCQLTYAPNTIGNLHAFVENQMKLF
jgi:hypothetical protein